jgi:hypothetical protein
MVENIKRQKYAAQGVNQMKRILLIFTAAFIILSSFIIPLPLNADGGPIVDPLLFAKLQEGQQIAVIRLQDTSTASVDLFVSILDQTGESHDISYFVPLGTKPSGFQVNEEDSLTFAYSLTETPDRILFQGYQNNQTFLQEIFAGALLTNGVWLTPLWLPMLLSSCGAAPTPVSSFSTPGSQVDIFNIDETTDLDALISTTGLDVSVKDTLSRLKGQQIAVIQLKTSPVSSSAPSTWSTVPTAQPGLHLSWVTQLTASKNGMTYAYPLGTGASWANPIQMTRVYVIAPLDINFNVQYPKLGVNRSGFIKAKNSFEPRIASYIDVSAYAVDEAIGQNGIYMHPSSYVDKSIRVWRAIFTHSNSAKDMMITVSPKRGITFRSWLWQKSDNSNRPFALILGLVVAVLFWILAWYFLVPRMVGKNRYVPGLWRISLTYIAWNLLAFLPGAILLIGFSYGTRVLALALMVILFGGVSALIFSIRHMNRLAEVKGKAIQIFAMVTLASGGAYLLFALGWAWLAKAI